MGGEDKGRDYLFIAAPGSLITALLLLALWTTCQDLSWKTNGGVREWCQHQLKIT